MMDNAPLDQQGTEHARKAAQHIIDTLNLPPQPNQSQGEGEEGEEGDGKGKGKGKGKGSTKGQGQGQGQGQGEGDGDADGEGSGAGKDEGDQPGECADGGGGGGDSKHGSGAKWTPQDLKDAEPAKSGPEQAVTQAAQHANDQAKNDGSEFSPQQFPSAVGNEYDFRKGSSYRQYLEAIKKGYGGSYDKLRRMLPSNLGSTRHALWRLLNSRDEAYVDRYREAGRWDNRPMPRML